MKPFIISTGFESDLRPYGAVTYDGVASGVILDNDGDNNYQNLSQLHILFDSLHKAGYDIVFVDQKAPRDYIQSNGLDMIKVIQWVNSELRKNGSNEKLVVMGTSMGGLIMRYALRMMEMQACCHNTRLYIAMDSPHNGGNISVASQYFSREMYQVANSIIPKSKLLFFDYVDDADSALSSVTGAYEKVLLSPAAEQMLIYHIDSNAATLRTRFNKLLDSIGQPQNCRRIAVANGSEIAKPWLINDPNKMLITVNNVFWGPFYYPIPGSNINIVYNKWHGIKMTGYSESAQRVFEANNSVAAINAYMKAWKMFFVTSSILYIVDFPGFQLNQIHFKINANNTFAALYGIGAGIAKYIPASNFPVQYTEAPGSQSQTFKILKDKASFDMPNYLITQPANTPDSLFLINIGTPSHTFMPTATALDMHESNLMLNIKDAYLKNQSITPFDCYWAPQRTDGGDKNMLHVQFDTLFNHPWIQEQILADWQLRNAQGQYKGLLSGYYNYGRSGAGQYNDDIILINKPYQTILYSLDIENNGRLYVNKQDIIGLPTGTLLPRIGSTFHLKTDCEPCDSTIVRIKAGGKFVVGELHGGILNKGEVNFCKNSRLEIFDGGQLIINDSSRLVIGSGATLVIHSGADILLAGSDAVLEIQGKIVIADNAALSPRGSGFIRWAAKMSPSDFMNYWQIGHNSSLVLANYNTPMTKKAEVAEDVYFPDSLKQVYANVRIELDSMKSIYAFGRLQAQNTLFTATDTTRMYHRVSVYGQPDTRFGNCKFQYGNYGLYANMSSGGNSFVLDSCIFTRNYVGLYTSDQNMDLNNCELNDNIDYGWLASGMQATSTISHCRFNNNGQAGIKFSSQLGVGLNIRWSQLNNNYQHGIEIEAGTLQANCSDFNGNAQAGIYAREQSEIILSGESKNSIRYNTTGILSNKAALIRLRDGYNDFSGNQYYLIGEVLPNNYYTPGTSPYGIDIDNNLMPASSYQGAYGLPVNIYCYDPQNTTAYQLPMNGWTQNISSINCICLGSAPVNYDNYKMFEGLVSVSLVNNPPLIQNTYLADALKAAAMQMSYGDNYTGNDTLAIALFKTIFDTIPPGINDDEQWAVDQALGLMMTALTHAIEHGLIDPNRALDGMPVNDYVAMIAQEIQNRLNDVNYADQYAQEQEAYLHLLMAQMYRAAEHYDYALSILQNPNYFFNTAFQNQADYWHCICEAENQLLKGNIERTQYEARVDSCHALSTARRGVFIPLYGTTDVVPKSRENQIASIYPNPASRLIAVEFELSIKQARIELCDINGRQIWQSTKMVNGKQLRLKLPELSPGTYMLKIITEHQVFNNKVIIR